MPTAALTSTPVRFIMHAEGQTVTFFAATDAERPAMSGAINMKCGNATSLKLPLMYAMVANISTDDLYHVLMIAKSIMLTKHTANTAKHLLNAAAVLILLLAR